MILASLFALDAVYKGTYDAGTTQFAQPYNAYLYWGIDGVYCLVSLAKLGFSTMMVWFGPEIAADMDILGFWNDMKFNTDNVAH